jgi:hypothetical protein
VRLSRLALEPPEHVHLRVVTVLCWIVLLAPAAALVAIVAWLI